MSSTTLVEKDIAVFQGDNWAIPVRYEGGTPTEILFYVRTKVDGGTALLLLRYTESPTRFTIDLDNNLITVNLIEADTSGMPIEDDVTYYPYACRVSVVGSNDTYQYGLFKLIGNVATDVAGDAVTPPVYHVGAAQYAGLNAATSPGSGNPFMTDSAVDGLIAAHNALATAHGLTANISAALAGAASPSADNVFATMTNLAAYLPLAGGTVTGALGIGVHGTSDASVRLSSSQREDFASIVWQGSFSGHSDPVLFHGYNPPNSAGYVAAEQSIYSGYEGYYWVDAGHQYLEWYVEWRTANGTFDGRAFQTSVEINTGAVTTTICGDTLIFANGANTSNYFQILGGAAAFSVPFVITGSSNAIQMLLKGYSTQTALIFQVQDSIGGNLLNVADDGIVIINSTAHPTAQTWALTHYITGTNGADVYMYGQQLSVIRDNGGPTFSWTQGFNSTVAVRALTANALSRYAYAGSFSILVQANATFTAQVSVSANIIEAGLTKTGPGTALVASPHGLHIYDLGGAGSYAPVGLYIDAQTAGATQGYAIYTNAGPVRFGDNVDLASGKVYKVNAVQVVGARVVDARLADTPNSGDVTTDGIIDALRDLVIAHGLGASA